MQAATPLTLPTTTTTLHQSGRSSRRRRSRRSTSTASTAWRPRSGLTWHNVAVASLVDLPARVSLHPVKWMRRPFVWLLGTYTRLVNPSIPPSQVADIEDEVGGIICPACGSKRVGTVRLLMRLPSPPLVSPPHQTHQLELTMHAAKTGAAQRHVRRGGCHGGVQLRLVREGVGRGGGGGCRGGVVNEEAARNGMHVGVGVGGGGEEEQEQE